ncbi:hypothetical protein [Methylobacterium brachiatum]|nr:hypothetical protein [Methylobacterium brachiatum]
MTPLEELQQLVEELRAELSGVICPVERARIREELRLAQAHLATPITT